MKNDKGKWRPTLVSVELIRAIAAVRQHGIDKYRDPDNWLSVASARYQDALLRHVYASFSGERLDPDSGLSHLAHAACNIMFLLEREREAISASPNAHVDFAGGRANVRRFRKRSPRNDHEGHAETRARRGGGR